MQPPSNLTSLTNTPPLGRLYIVAKKLKPSDTDAPEYNIQKPGLGGLVAILQRYAPAVAIIVTTTSLLVTQVIINTKGNPERRNMNTGGTSLTISGKTLAKSYTILSSSLSDTEFASSFILRNPEICTFLNRWIADDTDELAYDALKKEIDTMQSPENNTQATIASIRKEIQTRLRAGGTNSRALMEGLQILLAEQRRVEKLSDAFYALGGPHEIGKMSSAIADYNKAGGGMLSKKDWEDYALAIEQDRKMIARKDQPEQRKMGNGWEATDANIHMGAGTLPNAQKPTTGVKSRVQV